MMRTLALTMRNVHAIRLLARESRILKTFFDIKIPFFFCNNLIKVFSLSPTKTYGSSSTGTSNLPDTQDNIPDGDSQSSGLNTDGVFIEDNLNF